MSLKQIYKSLVTGFLFVIFGLICTLGNIFFIPIAIFGLNKFKAVENFSRDMIRISWGLFIKITKFFGYLDYEFKPLSEPSGATLVVANHPTLLDVVFLVSKFRRINCVVKGELSKNIFLFAAIKASNYIPNTQNEELLQASINALKSGQNLLIFPEGTRTKSEILFHKAAAYIAVNGAKNVIGIAIRVAPRSLRKNQPWYKTPDKLIKYGFKQIFNIIMSEFEPDRPQPIRARKFHAWMSENYEREFKDERFD